MKAIWQFIKAQPVLVISGLAAVVTAFFVPPDREWLGYCNTTVLIELFALMAAVAGLRSVGLFEVISQKLLQGAGTIRRLGLIFMLLCFFSAMLVTNDVALLTFVPLTLLVFAEIEGVDERSRIFVIILETAAANLGSMLTPIGNPQNLYLFDAYKLTLMDFLRTMLLPGGIGLVCLLVLLLVLPKQPCKAVPRQPEPMAKAQTAVFLAIFAVCLLAVFRVVPDWVCLVAAVVGTVIVNWRLLLKVDYALLATFVCFFVFVGNIGRIDAVRAFFSSILEGREVLVAALLSQGISNVPAAVMLADFTEKGTALLLGVDIGGFGTLIASLASLISFQIYRQDEKAHPVKYMLWFSAVNFGMLAVLLVPAVLLY